MRVFLFAFDAMTLTNVSSSQRKIQGDTKITCPRTSRFLLSFDRRHGNPLSMNAVAPIPHYAYVYRTLVRLLKYLLVVSEVTYCRMHMTC
jgi:hypothetical protein